MPEDRATFDCVDVETYMERALSQTLDAADMRGFDAHLTVCSRCRAVFASMVLVPPRVELADEFAVATFAAREPGSRASLEESAAPLRWYQRTSVAWLAAVVMATVAVTAWYAVREQRAAELKAIESLREAELAAKQAEVDVPRLKQLLVLTESELRKAQEGVHATAADVSRLKQLLALTESELRKAQEKAKRAQMVSGELDQRLAERDRIIERLTQRMSPAALIGRPK